MAHVQEFSYGWATIALSYLFSFLGCWAGLKATGRARLVTGAKRTRWLMLAAWAIGGTGIWVMHFVAMLGFQVDGTDVKFDVPTTVASWLAAVIVVGIGLFIVGYGQPTAWKILVAGVFTGFGVAGMHYTGMAAMRMDGTISYRPDLVWASIGIAVFAAIAALWFTVIIRGTIGVILAALVMGVAVCGMHYTAMQALRVTLSGSHAAVSGATALQFLLPILIFVLLVVIALGYAMLNTPSADDAAQLEALEERLARQPAPQVRRFG